MEKECVQSILSSHEERLQDIWRVSKVMIAQQGQSRKVILHGYLESSVNEAMDITMHAIKGRYQGPNSPIIVEREIYFDAMSTIQNRTEEFFAQYEKGNEELRLSKVPESNDDVEATPTTTAQQDQTPPAPVECKYFPRNHHITGSRIEWTRSSILWQHESHLDMERTRIDATAPQALFCGRTKEEIKMHVTSVLGDIYTAATRAAFESDSFAWDLIACHNWVNEKIYLRQGQWMALVSHHLDYLVMKLRAETLIEEEREKFLRKTNNDWVEALKSFTWLEACDCVRNHNLPAEDGARGHIEWAQEEVDKLLESARTHIEYIKSIHKKDEAFPLWESELNDLFSELEVRAGNFVAEQEAMVQEATDREIQRRLQETRMHLFRSLMG
ncbi:hypothetical protein E2P81_ATG00109 [Venturia nashicola]|uniref:Uncharacterized protein n=1 Tax=Venturia nashicola TaxID=86259 RepID=A0A4Z1PMF6_9PEZI|nr:hypothetical protein E6O75_ATG00116 [Venturia nashicola]TLD39122.1 hypothetical protein E2P81_ATG00109 [Venturia nashicola]